MKYEKLSLLKVQAVLIEKKIKLFTPDEFGRIFSITPLKAKYFLETYVKKGLFARAKKGLYIVKNNQPSEEEIANVLYSPSYISLEYALAYYGIIPEMVYAVTSITTKPTRHFVFNEKSFEYFTIKNSAFTGYSLKKEKEKNFLIAEPEKALADYLYFVSLGRKTLGDRINLIGIKKEKLNDYAKIFNRPKINKLIQQIYDQPRSD